MAKRKQRTAVVVRQKAAPQVLSSVDDGRGWLTLWNSGSQWDNGWFQKDIHYSPWQIQSNWVVWACQTLIAGDIGKLGVGLVEKIDGVFQDAESAPYSRLLVKPNDFQIWQQFIEFWSLSKQRAGNTYALKERDLSTRVKAMYVLEPECVTPLVAPDGSVYYRLNTNDLAGVPDEVVVPASEIMHDRFNCLFHPLVGLSPLFASALAASQGLTMQDQSTRFFANGSRPGGLLSTPGIIQNAEMERYKKEWETNFGGANTGRTAVLGNGLKYEAIRENAVDSELVAQLNMSAQMICSSYHVPAYKVGVGPMPPYQSAEILNQIYYDDCLQKLIEAIEGILDDGLDLGSVGGRKLKSQFDLDGLLRMDSKTKSESVKNLVGAGVMTPNEGRAKFGLPPVKGGEVPYLQQQNFGLPALSERDKGGDPFKSNAPAPTTPSTAANDATVADAAAAKFATSLTRKFMEAASVG